MKTLIIFLSILSNSLWISDGIGKLSISKVMHHKIITIKLEIGDCKECSRALEKTIIKLNGIQSVELIRKSKTLKIVYDPAYISESDIHLKIVEQGYDTELVKATDKAYNKLPDCCRYRKEID